MTRAPEPPAVGGVPASIAAIMAAIRHEVAAPPVADARGGGGTAPAPAASAPAPRAEPHAAPALPAGFDATAREMLAPLLAAWLDAHLPEIVETAVHAEIRRLTGQA